MNKSSNASVKIHPVDKKGDKKGAAPKKVPVFELFRYSTGSDKAMLAFGLFWFNDTMQGDRYRGGALLLI